MSWSKTSSGASGAMSCSYTDNRSIEEVRFFYKNALMYKFVFFIYKLFNLKLKSPVLLNILLLNIIIVKYNL